MRLYTLLKDTILFIRSVKSLLTDGSTLEDGYIVFPSGFKMCWATVNNLKDQSTVTLPISFSGGYVFLFPNYNIGTTMQCSFSVASIRDGNTFKVFSYNIANKAPSTATNLSIGYLAVGY